MSTLNSRLAILLLVVSSLLACGCGGPADAPVAESSASVIGRASFAVWQADDGRYYFHFTAANHEIVLASQSYSSRTAAIGGLLSVLDNAGIRERYTLAPAQGGGFYFTLRAANHEIIGVSEVYQTRQGAERGIATVDRTAADYLAFVATRSGARFVIFEGTDGEHYFQLRAQNGEIVLQSEGYRAEASAYNGAFSVLDNGTRQSRYRIERAYDGSYYFNLRAANGEVIGTSETYVSRYNAERARDAVIALLPDVDVF